MNMGASTNVHKNYEQMRRNVKSHLSPRKNRIMTHSLLGIVCLYIGLAIGTRKDFVIVREEFAFPPLGYNALTKETILIPLSETETNGIDVDNERTTKPEVYLWTSGIRSKDEQSSEFVHLYIDGITQSAAWTRIYNRSRFTPQTVWVTPRIRDPTKSKNNGKKTQLQVLEEEIREGLAERERKGIQDYLWQIYLISFYDHPHFVSWDPIPDLLANTTQNVELHYVQRSVIKNRKLNSTTNWIESGHVLPKFLNNTNGHVINAANTGTDSNTKAKIYYHRMNYPVRTDIVKTAAERAPILCQSNPTLSDPLEKICDRPIDVAHFWELFKQRNKPELRTVVNNLLVDQYCKSNLAIDTANFSAAAHIHTTNLISPVCFVGQAGQRAKQGRRAASTEYIDTMLRTKIVVVAQRSGWEGHFRLMEALVTGALVMTDRMLSLPFKFRDGVSLVEYASAEELLQKVKYYTDPKNEKERLAIAKEGRRLAMEEFRSWHLLEKLILGKIVTHTGYQLEPK